MIPPQSAADLAAQHLVLVAQYEQFDVLGQVRADQHRQQAEQEPQQAVGKRQQHSEMAPATLPIRQQTPAQPRNRVSGRDTVRGRPGPLGLDLAACRSLSRSRCQRNTVSGRASNRIRPSACGLSRCGGAPSKARSAGAKRTFFPPSWRSSTPT